MVAKWAEIYSVFTLIFLFNFCNTLNGNQAFSSLSVSVFFCTACWYHTNFFLPSPSWIIMQKLCTVNKWSRRSLPLFTIAVSFAIRTKLQWRQKKYFRRSRVKHCVNLGWKDCAVLPVTRSLDSTGLNSTEWKGRTDVAIVSSASLSSSRRSNSSTWPLDPAVAKMDGLSGRNHSRVRETTISKTAGQLYWKSQQAKWNGQGS